MAQNTTLPVPARTWTQITDADVSSITFQNASGYGIQIKGTTDATTPTDDAGTVIYGPGQGERNVALSDLFPGIAAVRVWAYIRAGNGEVMVSHA
jgi:hypothetical protein